MITSSATSVAAVVGQIGQIVKQENDLPRVEIFSPDVWLAERQEAAEIVNRRIRLGVLTPDKEEQVELIGDDLRNRSHRQMWVVPYSQVVQDLMAAGRRFMERHAAGE